MNKHNKQNYVMITVNHVLNNQQLVKNVRMTVIYQIVNVLINVNKVNLAINKQITVNNVSLIVQIVKIKLVVLNVNKDFNGINQKINVFKVVQMNNVHSVKIINVLNVKKIISYKKEIVLNNVILGLSQIVKIINVNSAYKTVSNVKVNINVKNAEIIFI